MTRSNVTSALASKQLEQLADTLIQHQLYGGPTQPNAREQATPSESSTALPWRLAAAPLTLPEHTYQQLEAIGPLLKRFMQAQAQIYRWSLNGQAPAWVAALCDAGKPEALIQYSRMNRFKAHLPPVIRPDLLLGEDGQLYLCEIDAIPGGIGITAALGQAYAQAGFPVQGHLLESSGSSVPIADADMVSAFAALLQGVLSSSKSPEPASFNRPLHVALVISDEAADYAAEFGWLAAQINHHPQYQSKLELQLVHPKALGLMQHQLVAALGDGRMWPIDGVYRFFELFDLPNIANIELLQFAQKKGWVTCLPPFKPVYEEKLWLALIHHPALQLLWRKALTKDDITALQKLIPQGWILDPAPLPPQAAIPGLLDAEGQALQSFMQLAELSQQQRQLVVKPSGFSPLAWGSRGVAIGHDMAQAQWKDALTHALAAFNQTLHVLQRFTPAAAVPVQVATKSYEVIEQPMRIRLCPYYFNGSASTQKNAENPAVETLRWAGTLATACPIDKKLIHGMADAVLMPLMAQ